MQNLDDIQAIQALDPSNVLGSIALFPKQCLDSWEKAKEVVFPDAYRSARNIVVCGMGGSRFTPKTIKELYSSQLTVPYEVVDDYHLPGYVDENTLVVLSSYSGTTEEVISCGEEALQKKAKLTGIAKGGRVIELLRKYSCPFYQFDPVHNPCGQPRVGGGYLLLGHLAFLSTLGFLSVGDEDVKKAVAWSQVIGKGLDAAVPADQNPAKQMALTLKDKHVFLVASEFLRGFVNGFANQLNETAKMISDFRYIPELNHHLMEGLKHPDALHENGIFVFLTSRLYSEKIQKRFAITKDVVEKQNIQTMDLPLKGTDLLSQTLEGYVLAGFITFYLAMLYDTDPVAIPWVDYFKSELAK